MMIPTVTFPYQKCTQKYHYVSKWTATRTEADGLRQDMKKWLNNRFPGGQGCFNGPPPKRGWNYKLEGAGIVFQFDPKMRADALYFRLIWDMRRSVFKRPAIKRPGG